MDQDDVQKNSGHVDRRGIEELARGAAFGLVGRLFGRLSSLLTQVLLARWLGPASYGLYSIGWNIQRALAPLATLGLEHGVIRFGAQGADHTGRVDEGPPRVSLLLGLAWSLGVGFALYLLADWLGLAFRKPGLGSVIRFFAAAVPLGAVAQIALAGTRLRREIRHTVIAEEFVQPLVHLSAVLVLLGLGYGLGGALAAVLLGMAGVSIVSLYFFTLAVRGIIPSGIPRAGAWRQLLVYSVPVAAAGMVSAGLGWVDRLAVGFLLSAQAAGIYQASVQLSLTFLLILASFNRILAPMIVHTRGAERGRMSLLYRLATRWGLYLALPLLIIIVLYPSQILHVLYGPQYRTGATPLVILSFAQTVNVATGGVGLLLIMNDHQAAWLRLSAAAGLVGLVLSVLLVPHLGLTGAALSVLSAMMLLFLSGLSTVRRRMGLWPYDWQILKGITAAIVTTAMLRILPGSAASPSLMILILIAALAVALFFGILWVLGFTEDDRAFLSSLRARAAPADPCHRSL